MICCCGVEQERNDRLVHTSITHGDIWCKKQSFSGLPQTARSVTEEEDEEEEADDDEKIGNLHVRKVCFSANLKLLYKLKRQCLSYSYVPLNIIVKNFTCLMNEKSDTLVASPVDLLLLAFLTSVAGEGS